MRFMMLMIPSGYVNAKPGALPDAKSVALMMAYNKTLQTAGVLLSLDGIHPPSMGARIHFLWGSKPTVENGPFPETKETLGGYWIIQVESREEAVAWATRCPASDHDIIEVRQIQEFNDFPPDVQDEVAEFADIQESCD